MNVTSKAVSGIGMITAVGNDKETAFKAICDGERGIDTITLFDPEAYSAKIAGEVKDFNFDGYASPKEARKMARFVRFAAVAAKEAFDSYGIDMSKEDPFRVGVMIGYGVGSLIVLQEQCKIYETKGPSRISPLMIPMLIVNEAAGNVSILLGAKGPNSCVATACAKIPF